MNITFLIGNGFDINLGLATKYTDFYPMYNTLNQILPEDDTIRKFSTRLASDYQKWSDFEYAFSQLAEGSHKEIGEIIADFDNRFATYLMKECKKCQYDFKESNAILQKFIRFPYEFLLLRDRIKLSEFYKAHEKEHVTYNFVSFNYTDTLDRLLGEEFRKAFPEHRTISNTKYMYYFNPILHLHGSFKEEYMIIGIDSLSQFRDEKLQQNPRLGRHCVKRTINAEYGLETKEEQFANLIAKSNLICTYGISFGASDRSRWELVKEWLKSNKDHKLLIFKFNSGFSKLNGMSKGLLLDAMDDAREEYLRLLGFEEEAFTALYPQIFVADSAGVLNFKLVDSLEKQVAATKEP